MDKRQTVLFLCTGNSARSQMAEALLRRYAGDRFDVFSAGLQPRSIHPLTLQVLSEIGIDTGTLRSKGVDEFLGKMSIHHAIVVCAKAQQSCPRLYPFALGVLYWPFEDPAALDGSPEEKLAKFREVRDQIDDQIHNWLRGMGARSA